MTDAYFTYVAQSGAYPSEPNARFYFGRVFRDVDFAGRRVLDIGGGTGYLSFYAAAAGAREVVCLEPESDGSSVDMQSRFRDGVATLNHRQVRLEPVTLQKFAEPAAPHSFDVVLVHNAINHLDEDACVALHESASAQKVYADIFATLARLTTPGALLLIADCTRSNFWPAIGRRNPFMASIEWHKHQPPAVWAKLLHPHGFHLRSLSWTSFNSLRGPGRMLLGNRLGAYFTSGHFVAWFQKTNS